MRALTIRQPWAWLILHGGKDIENRRWNTSYRGQFLIHAGKGMTRDEYIDAMACVADVAPEVMLPNFDTLSRGGIVGVAELWDVIQPVAPERMLTAPWHAPNQHGFRMRNVRPLPFEPCNGAQGWWGDWDIKDGKAVQL